MDAPQVPPRVPLLVPQVFQQTRVLLSAREAADIDKLEKTLEKKTLDPDRCVFAFGDFAVDDASTTQSGSIGRWSDGAELENLVHNLGGKLAPNDFLQRALRLLGSIEDRVDMLQFVAMVRREAADVTLKPDVTLQPDGFETRQAQAVGLAVARLGRCPAVLVSRLEGPERPMVLLTATPPGSVAVRLKDMRTNPEVQQQVVNLVARVCATSIVWLDAQDDDLERRKDGTCMFARPPGTRHRQAELGRRFFAGEFSPELSRFVTLFDLCVRLHGGKAKWPTTSLIVQECATVALVFANDSFYASQRYAVPGARSGR